MCGFGLGDLLGWFFSFFVFVCLFVFSFVFKVYSLCRVKILVSPLYIT